MSVNFVNDIMSFFKMFLTDIASLWAIVPNYIQSLIIAVLAFMVIVAIINILSKVTGIVTDFIPFL